MLSLSKLTAAILLTAFAGFSAAAESVLRLDEVAVGEIDPAKASDKADSILMFNLYDTLVIPQQGAPGHDPHLASSWDGEGTEYTFQIRDDITFISGNPLTAEDVVYSMERMQAIGLGLSHLFANVASTEATGSHTVQFTLSEPYGPFVASLVRLPIVDKQAIEANRAEDDPWGEAYLATTNAGTGAYVIDSHNPQEETVMVKNPGYFLGIGTMAPDTVRLRYGLEPATVRTLMAQGEHDITSEWLPPEVMRALVEEGNQLFFEGGTGGFYLKLNTQKPPLDDVNCRLALSNAFDYDSVLKLIAVTDTVSTGTPPTGAIPVAMMGANPVGNELKQDLDAARNYLAQCQYDPAEFEIEITWIAEVPLEERFALLLQANLAEIGIKSSIQKVPWAAFAGSVTDPANTPNVSQIFVTAVTGDPDTLLYSMYHSSVAGTWQSPEHLNDAEVDKFLEAGRNQSSFEARSAAYKQLNDRLMAIAPSIYGFDRSSVFAARPNIVAAALTDPSMAFGLDSFGFSFRLMEVH